MAKIIGIIIILLLLGCDTSSYKTFELSTTKVNSRFLETLSFSCPDNLCDTHSYIREYNISVTKTAANTIATWSITNTPVNEIKTEEGEYNFIEEYIYPYVPKYEQLEAELDSGAWQNFIKTLYSLVNERKKEYNDSNATRHNNKEWVIDIYSSDKDKPEQFKSTASNFDGFEKAIDSIKAKINEKTLLKKAEAENKLKAEYQKRFGESMTDAELSTTWIESKQRTIINDPFIKEYHIRVSKDIIETTAKAEILPMNEYELGHKVELSTGEWLDFVHALHKCSDKWLRKHSYNFPVEQYNYWIFKKIHSYIDEGSEEPFKYKRVVSSGYNRTYPKNWAEFMEIIGGMEAKIMERSGE